MDLVRTKTKTPCGDFSDAVQVWQDFIYHVSSLPGVTVLGTLKHDFPGGGLSGLILLGESHAAIHTWPEENLAWIELATCGDPAALDLFGSIYNDTGNR
jgi:S-adenosylmethionine/arginine decarboxylase-like enzyme